MPIDFFDTLSPGDRIVVRYRLEGPRGAMSSDALGTFVGVRAAATESDAEGETAGDAVVVRTRSGDVPVPRSAVTHAKLVPPAPERRRPRA